VDYFYNKQRKEEKKATSLSISLLRTLKSKETGLFGG
jgi:hypothetical protein